MDEELINDKLQLAKLYFKSKDYTLALRTYTLILTLILRYNNAELAEIQQLYNLPSKPLIGKLHHPKLSSILDSRAATYEKIGEIDKALKDSEKSLSYNPIDIKAYLRIGKNYSKLGDEVKAFRNYQCGNYLLTKFLEKNPNYEINKELLSRLKHNYTTTNTLLKRKKQESDKQAKKAKKLVDPLDALEFDVLHLVLSELSVSDLLVCHLVSKKWYSTLMSFPKLYENIVLKSKIRHKEFLNSVKLFNRFKKQQLSIRINPTTNLDFIKILDNLVKLNYKMKSFEVLNPIDFNELLTRFDKYAFKFHFKSLKRLKLLLTSNPSDQILNLFLNIEDLELLVFENNRTRFPLLKYQNAYTKALETSDTYIDLKYLALISESTLTTYPCFLSCKVNLTRLVMANLEFDNFVPAFGSFLQNCSSLKSLTLENNRNILLKMLIQNLINYRSDFKLKHLAFREHTINSSFNMNEFTLADLHNFSELESLDLYSTSLSNNGLVRFIGCCPLVHTLLLGSSNYIYFKNDTIDHFVKLSLLEVLVKLPHLHKLSLIDLNLDNLSLSFFSKDLERARSKLSYLELSFNTKIDGIGLLSLLDYDLGVSELVLDGIQINLDTLRFIESKFKIKVRNDYMKTQWRTYGINTLVR